MPLSASMSRSSPHNTAIPHFRDKKISYLRSKRFLGASVNSPFRTLQTLECRNESPSHQARDNSITCDIDFDRHSRSLAHCAALHECDEVLIRHRWRKIQRGLIVNPLSDWWQAPTAIPSFIKWLQENARFRADMKYKGGSLRLTEPDIQVQL